MNWPNLNISTFWKVKLCFTIFNLNLKLSRFYVHNGVQINKQGKGIVFIRVMRKEGKTNKRSTICICSVWDLRWGLTSSTRTIKKVISLLNSAMKSEDHGAKLANVLELWLISFACLACLLLKRSCKVLCAKNLEAADSYSKICAVNGKSVMSKCFRSEW